jgi:hypothetical protein
VLQYALHNDEDRLTCVIIPQYLHLPTPISALLVRKHSSSYADPILSVFQRGLLEEEEPVPSFGGLRTLVLRWVSSLAT